MVKSFQTEMHLKLKKSSLLQEGGREGHYNKNGGETLDMTRRSPRPWLARTVPNLRREQQAIIQMTVVMTKTTSARTTRAPGAARLPPLSNDGSDRSGGGRVFDGTAH